MDLPGSNFSFPPAGTSQYPVPASPYPGQGAIQPTYATAFNDALQMLCSIVKLNASAPYMGAPGGVDHHAFMRANIGASEAVNHLKAIVGAPSTIQPDRPKLPIRNDSGLERVLAKKSARKETPSQRRDDFQFASQYYFDARDQKPCAVCGVPSPLVCILCLEEYYCSHDCQHEAWGDHELVCRKRGTASGGQRNGHTAIKSNLEHGKVSAENESNKYNGEASTQTTESLRRPVEANMYLRPSNKKPMIRNQKQHRQQIDTKSNASDSSSDSKRTMNKDNYQKPFKRNSGFNNNSYLKPNADSDNNRKPYSGNSGLNKTNGYLKPDSDSDTCKKAIKNDVTQTKPISQPNLTASRKTEASSETEVKTRIEAGMVRNVALTSAESLTDYWVSLKDDESELMRLASELSKRITDRSPGLKKASVGDWCCKVFDGCWSRVRVVSADPLTVLYVDYGNSEAATLDQLRELPADLGERPFLPFAIHVTHPAGIGPADADQVFPLRFISHDPQGLWTVEKARPDELTEKTEPCGQDVSFVSQTGRNEVSLPPMLSTQSPSSVSTTSCKSPYFEEGKVYKVLVREVLSLTEFYVTKLELKEELEKLQSELNSMVSDSSQPIQNLDVKSKCAAKYQGEWYRASVQKLDPLTVLFIDYGNEETCQPSDVKELPPKFRTRMLTARVRLTRAATKKQILAMDSGEPIQLEALKKDGSHWLVDYSTHEELTEKTEPCGQDVSFVRQTGRNEVSLPPMLSSPSPSCVSTAPYFEEGKIYKVFVLEVLSLTELYVTKFELKEELGKLQTELNSVVSDSSQPIQNLDVKSKCAAKYQGEWYRASVQKLDPLTVLFIDYGNEETCQPSDIKELPPKFKTGVMSVRVLSTSQATADVLKAAQLSQPINLRVLNKDASHWLVDYSTDEELSSQKEPCGQDVSFVSQTVSLPPMLSSPSPSCVSTPSSKSPYFEEGKVYKVVVRVVLSLTEMYVTKFELKEELEKLQTELNSVVSDSSQPIQNLDVKSKCAAKYQGEWYRASVQKLDPLTVLFIDYGNEETCQPSDVKELPPKFRTRLLTARVRLARSATKEQIIAMDSGEPIQLEALKKDGSHWLVEQSNSITEITEQNQTMPSRDTPEETKSSAKPNTDMIILSNKCEENTRLGKFTKILDVFKEGDSAYCEVMRVLDDERITCILGSRASTREQYMKIYGLDLDPLGEPYRPKMNEMVGVHWEENAPFWRRGLVLSEMNGSYNVALVDSGFLVVSSNLRALPDDIKNIPLMSVKLCLTSSARVSVQQGDVLSVKLVKKLADSGEWEAEVYSTGDEPEHLGAGRLCEWNVEPDQVPELATLKLESGDEVIISSFHDISKIYVQPFSPQKAAMYQSLSQEVAAEGIKAKRLGRDPVVGELVAAYWDQTCKHLRAQILEKVNAEGYYKVLFVDNGNIDEIHVSKMKLLSNKLKTLRRCAVEIGLDGIEYKGLSPDAFNYLIQLAKLKEPLKITFADLKLVQLTKVSDKTDINKEIGKLFNPNKSQTHDTGTRQKQSDIFAMRTFPKRTDLPEPDRDVILRIGETQKLMVPYVPPFKSVGRDGRVEVVACNASKKAITKYTIQLRDQMTDYVASQPTNRYVPRGGELCVCLEDEVPFRAECVKVFVNHARVRDIDYGNEADVKFEQIFKMTNDLMQFPAYATYCYAEGIPANTTFEELEAVFVKGFDAKIKRYNDEHYTFYSPEIIARLTNK